MKKYILIHFISLYLFVNCTVNNEKSNVISTDSTYNEAMDSTTMEEKAISKIPVKFYPVYTENEIMIFDSVELNTHCYLIDLKRNLKHKTKTTVHKLFSTEMFDKKVTLTENNSLDQYQLVVFGSVDSLEWVKKELIQDTMQRQEILKNINLVDYGSYFEDFGAPISVYQQYIEMNPIIEKIKFQNDELYLITYKIELSPDDKRNGPSFLMSQSNSKIYPLSGPCSKSESDLFVLNNKLYIYTGSNCCECGIVVDQLYEFDGKIIQKIIEDWTWST